MKTIRSNCRGFTASYLEAVEVLVIELAVDKLIDVSLISDIQKDIVQLIAELEPRALVLGFEDVSVFSSEIISVVLELRRKMMQLGGSLKLTGLSSGVSDVFHHLKLDETMVQMHATTSEALQELEREPHVIA